MVAVTLLDRVGEFVRDQVPALERKWIATPRAEHDVLTDRVGLRPKGLGALGSVVVGEDANVGEAVTEPGFKGVARRRLEASRAAARTVPDEIRR